MSRKKKPRGSSARARESRSDKPHRSKILFSLFAVAGVIAVGLLAYLAFQNHRRETSEATAPTAASNVAANYVGTATCKSCHDAAYNAWRGSQHERAMQEANEHTVLGSFADAKFSYAGVTSTFFKRDGKFFVTTDGPDGKLKDYEIKYTFGVTPLQQYLIEMPGVRFQALSIAWDARPKEQGGQRWFHLYPKKRITHNDELHWTRSAQNWNFMCADCHSTGLRKNYDPATNSFKTQWAEISVGCEACHGPGSNHVAWAKSESPTLKKGRKGGFESAAKIPLNPPFSKGDFDPQEPLFEKRGRRRFGEE